MFTKRFWVAASERAIKSVAQAILLYSGGDVVFNAWGMDWRQAAGIAAGAAFLSILTSLISVGVNDKDSPSLTKQA